MWPKIGKSRKRKAAKAGTGYNSDRRMVVLAAFWCGGLLLILLRLVQIQVWDHSKYENSARRHLENRRELPAQRGTITDRNGEVLAVDLIHYSIAVKPGQIKNRTAFAAKVSPLLGISSAKTLQKMRAAKSFVYLAHRVSNETAEKLRALKLPGILFEKKFSRYYPYNTVAAQLLGYCDYDNQARAGLELEYEKVLKGKPGYSNYLRDALGNQVPNLDFPASQPLDGLTVETTVNVVYQSIIEEELKKAVQNHAADNGSVVLMDPHSGEVLAMADYPGFNPNQYNDFPMESYRNRAVADLYEPGSTFKMISLALCIDQLNLNLDKELVFCENGAYPVASKVVKDHEKFAYLTARQVFEKSSNIGVIKLARRFDASFFYRYARDFGFGQLTGIDLPAEEAGILHKPNEYSSTSLSYMSIGYEVAVTPLQIAQAYGAVANEGRLMQPYVLRRLLDKNGQVVSQNHPVMIRQVVSPATAARMCDILYGAVEHGTGRSARVDGLEIAGKTGTAQKVDLQTSGYFSNRHVASFAGFFPVNSPRFVLVVVINNPRKGYYGSQVAAPVFRNIAEQIAGIPFDEPKDSGSPQYAAAQLPAISGTRLMALEGLSLGEAIAKLKEEDIEFEVVGSGKTVLRQEPPAPGVLPAGKPVKLYTEEAARAERQAMPRLTGLTLKEALQIMAQWNIIVEVEGSGVVVQQFPKPGSRLAGKDRIKLVCQST